MLVFSYKGVTVVVVKIMAVITFLRVEMVARILGSRRSWCIRFDSYPISHRKEIACADAAEIFKLVRELHPFNCLVDHT